MVGEKKEDDIVGRLEALRKKVPPPTIEKPVEKPREPTTAPDDKRKKLARVIGILVIIIILGGVFFVGSKMLRGPETTPGPVVTTPPSGGETDAEKQARIAELAKAKSDRISEVEAAFSGLPPEYTGEKDRLKKEVEQATTKDGVNAVRYELPAANAWRNYRKDEVNQKAAITGAAIAQIGNVLVKGSDDIKRQIESLTVSELQGMVIREMRSEFIPIRLPRDQFTGGFAEVGDRVNLHYRWNEIFNGSEVAKIKYLAKDGRVVAIMKPASTISLSESEQQKQFGGGAEGKGNVTTISLGASSIAISDGPYGASVGYKQIEKSSTYAVNLAEVQKAAAASKVSLDDFMRNMDKYGARLSEIERETNIADLNTEYLMLVEVSQEEASEIALRLLNQNEKANILVTISKAPTWAS